MNTHVSIPAAVQPADNYHSVVAVTTAHRVAYIDMLRGFLIALVIIMHAACTYNGSNDWTYSDPRANDEVSSVLLSLFVLDCQSFFMSLYFFLSGLFTPKSYDSKGVLRFWKDRIIHLLIPAVIYMLMLSRIPNYLDDVANQGVRASFWQYSLRTFWTEADAGPTWFIFALLLFSALFTLIKLLSRWMNKSNTPTAVVKKIPAPGIPALLITALVMAAAMFTIGQFLPIVHGVRIFGAIPFILGFFPFYLIFFFGGMLAYHNRWLEQWKATTLKFWGWLSAGLLAFLPLFLLLSGIMTLGLDVYFFGGNWRCLVTCLWLAFACVSFSMFLTLWMREHVKPGSTFAAFSGENSYAVFLIHPAILVGVSVLISRFTWHPMIKFAVSSLIAVPVCFGLAAILRRIPILKKVI